MKEFLLKKIMLMLVALLLLSSCTILNNNIFRGDKYLVLDNTNSDTDVDSDTDAEINLTAWKDLVKGKTLSSFWTVSSSFKTVGHVDTTGLILIDHTGVPYVLEEDTATANSATYRRISVYGDYSNEYIFEFSKVTSSGGIYVYSCYDGYWDIIIYNDAETFTFND